MVNCPASLSATHKRERHYFTTRDLAKEHASGLREKALKHGRDAIAIRPSLAEAATEAEAILAPWGLSLVEAARAAVAVRERETASRPMAEATAAFMLSCEGLRDRTIEGYRQVIKRLDAALGTRLLASITADEMAAACGLVGAVGAAAANRYRCARAFWNWSAGKGWCQSEIFEAVGKVRVDKDGEISVLTVDEARALLTTAETHFPQAVASYALQLFSGIRVEELARLEACHVSTEGINLTAAVSKKSRRRHIELSPTLKAWIEVHPFTPCPNWREVHDACRRLAGWDVASRILSDRVATGKLEAIPQATRGTWPQNVLRHSFASYAIAKGISLPEMLFTFGHVGGENLLRSNYAGRVTKKAALQYFAIRPAGSEAAGAQLETVENVA